MTSQETVCHKCNKIQKREPKEQALFILNKVVPKVLKSLDKFENDMLEISRSIKSIKDPKIFGMMNFFFSDTRAVKLRENLRQYESLIKDNVHNTKIAIRDT